MASLNKVTLIGNIGNDPDTTNFNDGNSKVSKIRLATNRKWKDKDNVTNEKTEWHQLIFFNKLADIAHTYYKKGMQIYVEGRLETRNWVDKDGITRYTTEIIVENSQMLGNSINRNNSTEKTNQTTKSDKNDDYSDWVDEDDIPF